ncbi:TPA: DUF3265 domain-containing protein, partial [Vibrio vulnificus]|nr:DUF3265 domain-containing protein [Vibrio vulnificus]
MVIFQIISVRKESNLTNCLRVIRNAWHFWYALVLVVKVICR